MPRVAIEPDWYLSGRHDEQWVTCFVLACETPQRVVEKRYVKIMMIVINGTASRQKNRNNKMCFVMDVLSH